MSEAPSAALLFITYRQLLVRQVARSFPGLCISQIEDFVAYAFEVAVSEPERLDRAWVEGGEMRVLGLLRVIAWRKARGHVLRRSTRLESSVEVMAGWSPWQPAGQEAMLQGRQALARGIDDVARSVSRAHATPLATALVDKLQTGDSDTSVAARNGVRREYLNRAKKQFLSRVFA